MLTGLQALGQTVQRLPKVFQEAFAATNRRKNVTEMFSPIFAYVKIVWFLKQLTQDD
jgi:hypothetical protein